MIGLIMLPSLTADLEASLVPVIYLTIDQCLRSETAPPCCGHCAAESCNPTREAGVRLLTLVNSGLSGKQIALAPLECQGGRIMFPAPCKPQTFGQAPAS